MAQIDDLMAAVAADQAASDAAVALLQGLTASVATLQTTVTDLQAQLAAAGNPVDLQPAIDQVNSIAAELQTAENPAPPAPAPGM